MNKEYKPLKLMPNQIYPTYQLHAEVANKETPPDDAMKIVILEVMAWLRERFRDLDMPKEIQLPSPKDYQTFDLSDLKPFKVDPGYTVEVGFRLADRAWALELREPDLGPRPEDTGNNRKPAPGRTFTTNIAVRIHDGVVDCGFRTMVAELKGEKIPCEVFRLAVIKRLVENTLLGLKQDHKFKIIRKPYLIDNFTDLKQLVRFLSEEKRQLPAVVFVRCKEGGACDDPEKTLGSLELPRIDSLSQSLHPGQDKLKKSLPKDADGFYDLVADMAQHRMGYANFFYLTGDMHKKYNELTGMTLNPGDATIVVPKNLKGRNSFFHHIDDPAVRRANMKQIEDQTQEFLKGQAVSFDGVWFLPEINNRNKDDAFKSSLGTLTLEQIKDELNKQYAKELSTQLGKIHGEYAVDIGRLEREQVRLNKELEKFRTKQNAEQEAAERNVGQLKQTVKELSEETKWLRDKACLPKDPCDVAEWVAKRYAGKLIFHDKAIALMEDLKIDEVDMELLGSALEFLAEEYRSRLIGELSEDEMLSACARKYGRPFEVAPQKGGSVDAYPLDYKIKYFVGKDGKRHESALDRHLRVGNDSENLLRIYFLYDPEKQLIVVGSLPKHLKTLTFG